MYVSGLPQVFHDDEQALHCLTVVLCNIELMVSAASDETAHCGESHHLRL